jgi:FGGY family of carbohydrate kinases, C-terminal domain.
MVTTPSGEPVAMVHCNNFTSDINDWVGLFKEVMELMNVEVDTNELFTRLYEESLNADADVGKIVGANYYSGEPITGFEEGRPLLVRMPDSKLTAANFMRSQIYSALATLKIGMDILTKEENVQVDYLLGHGGFFRTKMLDNKLWRMP